MSDSGQHAEEEWITAEEVAARASCSPEAVRMALESGAFQGEVRDEQCWMAEEAAETFVALVRMLRQEGAQAAVNVYGGQVEKLVQVWQARDVIIEARPEQPVPRQAPRLTQHFVGRGRELKRLRKLLLGPEEASIVAVTAVQGMGGVGKSALVSELARDEETETAFPDGTLWVTLGKTPDVLSVLGGFASAYGYDFSQLTTVAERTREVRSLLHDRQALIVLDDAWDVMHVRPLLVGGPGCKTVMTTRQKQVADGARARLMRLDVLPEGEAITLVAQWLGRELEEEDRERARQLARLVAYLPLAVELAAAQVPEAGWDWVLERLGSVRRLETLELEEAETKWESVRLALELSYEALRDKEPKQRFRALGTFAVGATFNAAATAGVWGCDENEAVDGLRRLARAAMVDRLERGRWRVHDLLMDYALERLVEAGEEAAARERHARYYLEFAEAHEEDWQAIEAELAQIRAGWRWATSLDEVNEALVLSYALGLKDFQRKRGYWGEGLVWLKRGRQACESLGNQRKLGSVLNAMGLVGHSA